MVIIGVALRYQFLKDGRSILYLGERLRRTLQKAGAFVLPIVPVQDCNYMETKYDEFPPLTDSEKKIIDDSINLCDGIIFPGGCKITPFDVYLLERCIELNKKVLGICLGMQLLSNYKRNFLTERIVDDSHFQDDDSLLTHKVILNKKSKLYQLIGVEEILVNSFHHYHVLENSNLFTVGMSDDGFIEAIELEDKDFVVGVQWHPEISYDFDALSRKIIDGFIKICEEAQLKN